MFQEEYMRFLQDMLDMPEYQPCSVADAAAVLLHAETGVIRVVYGNQPDTNLELSDLSKHGQV